MEDRGEKIVFLARELLESRENEKPHQKKTLSVTMTFKTLCFTTLLAAATGNIISTYVHEKSRPLNKYERIELQALVFYASRTKSLDEATLRQSVEQLVGIETFDDMTAKEFAAARHFLQEKAQ
ncbi:MAG: hypothetical protein PHS57_07930 [Alphaproteobacteria bacterium]|nr:hypothetical protein [Alphaproteobacteria bacterium]